MLDGSVGFPSISLIMQHDLLHLLFRMFTRKTNQMTAVIPIPTTGYTTNTMRYIYYMYIVYQLSRFLCLISSYTKMYNSISEDKMNLSILKYIFRKEHTKLIYYYIWAERSFNTSIFWSYHDKGQCNNN